MSLVTEDKYNTYKFDNEMFYSRLSKVIQRTLENNKNHQNDPQMTKLFSKNRRQIYSIEEYILRLKKYLKFDKQTFILGLIYLDRICDLNNFLIKFENFYRLFFISLILAIKYNHDSIHTNAYYAKIDGMSVKN